MEPIKVFKEKEMIEVSYCEKCKITYNPIKDKCPKCQSNVINKKMMV
jgi:hypothetical protein